MLGFCLQELRLICLCPVAVNQPSAFVCLSVIETLQAPCSVHACPFMHDSPGSEGRVNTSLCMLSSSLNSSLTCAAIEGGKRESLSLKKKNVTEGPWKCSVIASSDTHGNVPAEVLCPQHFLNAMFSRRGRQCGGNLLTVAASPSPFIFSTARIK